MAQEWPVIPIGKHVASYLGLELRGPETMLLVSSINNAIIMMVVPGVDYKPQD